MSEDTRPASEYGEEDWASDEIYRAYPQEWAMMKIDFEILGFYSPYSEQKWS